MKKQIKNSAIAILFTSLWLMATGKQAPEKAEKARKCYELWKKPSIKPSDQLIFLTAEVFEKLFYKINDNPSSKIDGCSETSMGFVESLMLNLEAAEQSCHHSCIILPAKLYDKISGHQFLKDWNRIIEHQSSPEFSIDPAENYLEIKTTEQWHELIAKWKNLFEKLEPCFKSKLHKNTTCDQCSDHCALLSFEIQELFSTYKLESYFNTKLAADFIVYAIVEHFEEKYPHKIDEVVGNIHRMLEISKESETANCQSLSKA